MSRKLRMIKLGGTSTVITIRGAGTFMIYVGIDIAKQKHFASVMSAEGEILIPPFSFTNDHSGFQLILSKLSAFEKELLIIGLESTAHYGENLICFLFSRGFRICVINPIQTATLRKTNIRKTKTDSVDTYLIIKALIMNQYRLFTQRDLETLKLKNLCRFRQKLIKARTKVKIQLVSYVDQLFPELQYFFKSGIHINTCYSLLKECSDPDKIAAMNLTKLSNLLRKASQGRFKKDTAIALKELASKSVGTKNHTLSLQISQSIIQIELYDQQLQELDMIIKSLMDEIDSVIKSVPGIGIHNGAAILGEIGDIHRFHSSCQLLAYAGLDPSVNQSGKFSAQHTRMSKRGSKMLRYALINAAWQATLNNKTLKDYYDLKVSQGRSHYNALGHVAHKLVRIIHKMMTNNLKFNLA